MNLTIIIACYNVAHSVERTIESVFRGGYLSADIAEVIAINDGSTDNTLKVLQTIALKFPINIINQTNQGVGKTKNKGLEIANGI